MGSSARKLRRVPSVDNGRGQVTELLDRSPPADVEAEKMLLGSIIHDPRRLAEVTPLVGRDDFYAAPHALLWEHLSSMPPDVARDAKLLLRWIPKADLAKIGGEAALAEIIQSVPYAANAAYYAKIVAGLSVKRRAIQGACEVIRAAHDPSTAADALASRWEELTQVTGNGKPADAPGFAKMLTSAELATLDLKLSFLVRGVLAESQPCIIGGRSKVLKTSVAVDLAVSLGSGKPFLGKFDSHKVAVGFWSGESGAATIKETALRIADSKGVDLSDCAVQWCFELPRLSQLDHLDHLHRVIDAHKLRVAIVDPLYLCLLDATTAGAANNLFFMGAMLQGLTRLGQDTGCTVVLLHHFRKGGAADEENPAALEELAQSGVAEWARQWILLQRRVPYEGDGQHLLWMRAGGSAGHASLWGLSIDEGQIDPDTFGGRTWQVTVNPAADIRAQTEQDKANRTAAKLEKKEGEYRDRLLPVLRACPEGDTARGLRIPARLSDAAFDRAISTLIQEGRAERCMVVKNRRQESGFRPTGK